MVISHRILLAVRILVFLSPVIIALLLPVPARATASDDNRDQPAREALAADDLYDVAAMPRKVRKVVFRAAAYGKRGDYRKAADLLFKHLSDHPEQDHHLLRLHLAQHLSDMDRSAEALEHYRAAIELQPDLDRGWMGLGDAAYDLERYEVAGEAFLWGYETSRERPAEVLYYAAASYLMADEPAKALPIFERLVTERRDRAHIKWYQGLVIAAAGVDEPARADAAVRQLLDTTPEDPEAWFLSYQHSVGKREFRAAAVSLTAVGHLRGLNVDESRQLGDLYSVAEVPWLASRAYTAALRDLPDEPEAGDYERLVSALVSAHETEDALGILDEALATEETSRLVSLRGDIHYLRRDYAAAAAAYARLAELGDDTGRAWLMQGYCALELGQRGRALDLLGRASGFEAHAEMAQLLMQRALRLES